MRRQVPDRVPKFADFSPGIYARFLEHVSAGVELLPLDEKKGRPLLTYVGDSQRPNPADYFNYDVRIVEFGETKLETDFSPYFDPQQLPEGRSRINEWGIGFVKGSEHHFEEIVPPMASFTSIDELESYPWPDVTATYRRDIARERTKEVQELGYAAVGWPPMKGGTFFETAWGLRGFEALIMDMMTNQDFAACLLDKITALSIANAVFFADSGVDVLLTGDDFGMQERMIISPEMWREWFKPRYAALISAAKEANPDLLVFYHSDGMIEPIIPELVEVGIDILNPVQPECLDPAKLKKTYGDQLAFWGTIGTQSTLPYGTVEEVRATVKERIETVGCGGGLLLAPTHLIEPDVPWENILALFDAIEEFGSYA
jgi:uroporphyrinogen decarboxylase